MPRNICSPGSLLCHELAYLLLWETCLSKSWQNLLVPGSTPSPKNTSTDYSKNLALSVKEGCLVIVTRFWLIVHRSRPGEMPELSLCSGPGVQYLWCQTCCTFRVKSIVPELLLKTIQALWKTETPEGIWLTSWIWGQKRLEPSV